MKRYTTLLSTLAAMLVLAACGGSGNGGNGGNGGNPAPPPPPPPPPAPEAATIRGLIDQRLPSGNLPSASLPSRSLPSSSLPSVSLPTVEVDETPSVAELRTVNVSLEASQEVTDEPLAPGNDNLTATGIVSVNETTGDISATVTAQNLDDTDTITMMHIHSGFAGENGGVLVGLDPTADPLVFEVTTTIADLADIPGNDLATFLAGGWYLNLHTESNPAGQLRGQIFTQEVDVVRMSLEGQQENPAIVNAEGISGIAYATFDVAAQNIVVNSTVEGFVPFLDAPVGPVHLHTGFAGENGPVVLPLQPVDGSETVYRGTEADLVDVLDFTLLAQGGTYINVHSEANPGGEVRGQLVPRGVDAVRMDLEGQQQNPAIVNAAGIAGVAYVTFNADEQRIVANSTVEGFVPFLDAPVGPVHLHTGFAGENGPVVLPLQPVDGSETVYRGTEADLVDVLDFAQLAQGGTYINVHSEANPGGEVRGQIVPRNVDATRMVLEGQQENPAIVNEEGIAGIAYATFNAVEERIVLNTTVEGFVPFLNAPVGPVHLHTGFAGENGPVVLPLQPVDGSETVYRGTEADLIDVLDFAQLAQGGTYINVHSEANPGGEVRGQLVPRNVDTSRMVLEGQQQNPAVVNAEGISGIAYATFNAVDERIVLNTTVEGFEPFLNAPIGPVHLHTGFAGENGPVVLPLQPVDGSQTVFRGTEADLIDVLDFAQLTQGGTYINVHSADNPGGEVRGQLVAGSVEAVRIELQGQQENPVVVNADGISGVAYATFNAAEERIVLTAAVEGFVPFLDAPIGPVHLHAGYAGENGPVVLPLQAIDGSETEFRGTEADVLPDQVLDFEQLLRGQTYINVHSEDNPGGEVRGQIVSTQSVALRSELTGAQALPADDTMATGVGYLTLTDLSGGLFVANLRLTGLDATSVTVNAIDANGGADTLIHTLEQDAEDPAFFAIDESPVLSVQGTLNGNYSFAAEGTESQ